VRNSINCQIRLTHTQFEYVTQQHFSQTMSKIGLQMKVEKPQWPASRNRQAGEFMLIYLNVPKPYHRVLREEAIAAQRWIGDLLRERLFLALGMNVSEAPASSQRHWRISSCGGEELQREVFLDIKTGVMRVTPRHPSASERFRTFLAEDRDSRWPAGKPAAVGGFSVEV
jgi:hypothetical protein